MDISVYLIKININLNIIFGTVPNIDKDYHDLSNIWAKKMKPSYINLLILVVVYRIAVLTQEEPDNTTNQPEAKNPLHSSNDENTSPLSSELIPSNNQNGAHVTVQGQSSVNTVNDESFSITTISDPGISQAKSDGKANELTKNAGVLGNVLGLLKDFVSNFATSIFSDGNKTQNRTHSGESNQTLIKTDISIGTTEQPNQTYQEKERRINIQNQSGLIESTSSTSTPVEEYEGSTSETTEEPYLPTETDDYGELPDGESTYTDIDYTDEELNNGPGSKNNGKEKKHSTSDIFSTSITPFTLVLISVLGAVWITKNVRLKEMERTRNYRRRRRNMKRRPLVRHTTFQVVNSQERIDYPYIPPQDPFDNEDEALLTFMF
ncbi:hypothetical protein RF11_11659 [Thelohanellus kitauei]|uniref:Uncharacterized protein n=1 Tax=Thelohanellus kitauei TaxID=669202 RepID=A0A0C2MFN9_THEKT|nr:hypothetical protein RF11_11659 [Thelohanellus kitauei]